MSKKIATAKGSKTRTWLIVSVILTVVLVIANALGIYFNQIISIFLGGDVAHKVDDGTGTVYYQKETDSKDEANQNARAITQLISEEGTILLKNANEALPLKDNASVSVFGKNSVNLVYGGSGSGGGDTTYAKKTLYEALDAEGISYNPTLKAFYEDNSKSGKGRADNPSDLDSGKTVYIETGETPQDAYTENNIANSYTGYKDAAIVVFSRVGGEGFDLPMDPANGARHYLSMDTNEQALLEHVTNSGFDKVIVVLNTLNIMETGFLDEYEGKIDACLWIGGPGSTGIMALGKILEGTVTPSGHTTDTWSYDFRADPTFNNFSDRGVKDGGVYFNSSNKKTLQSFALYEESVYVGYRYYETRAYEESKLGNTNWYAENVKYPFGYGLSYTSFEWELDDAKSISNVSITADGKYSVTVKVTNTGDYQGKDVVQLYAKLPYTAGGIEKPHVVLCGYAKTPMLAPTESATVTITFDPYDIASYDYLGKSGEVGYVLEASNDYELLIGTDAHDAWANENAIRVPFKVENTIRYTNDPVTGNKVENRYTNCENEYFNSDMMIKDSLMSRTDLSVLPDAPNEEDRKATTELLMAIADETHNNLYAETYTEMPTQGQVATTEFASVLQQDPATGKWYADYENNKVWDTLLDSISVNAMLGLFNEGAFKTNRLESINKPQTLDSDGPVGWCNFIATDGSWKGNNVYTSQVVMSATWNVELIEEMGRCVGEEGLWGAVNSDGRPYSGWYSPGVNLHRSPFGGRNFEYFSEDSFLTGTIAAAEVRGCKEKGVYCYVKHFALNEQETHRNGICTWVTEQAMREIYLKPFEIVVKEGGTTALMSSFNRIGTRWTGGDYRLLTEILRDEWGFKGTVICDYNQTGDYMDPRQMIYAGGDLNLCSDLAKQWQDCNNKSAADVTVLRKATKNILYTVANSNAVNSLSYVYTMAIWKIALICVDVAAVIGIIISGIIIMVSRRKKKILNNRR